MPLLSFIYVNGRIRPSNDAVRDLAERELHHRGKSGMGPQGLYYYFHTMSKALSLSGIESMRDSDGKKEIEKGIEPEITKYAEPSGLLAQ